MKVWVFIYLLTHVFLYSTAAIQSVSSGNWNNASTWDSGTIPTASDDVEIVSGHEINLTAHASIHNIILSEGKLHIADNALTIFGTITGTDSDSVFSTSFSELYIEDTGNTPEFIFPAGIQTLQKLSINRARGARTSNDIYLDTNVPADGIVLTLTNGIILIDSDSKMYLNDKTIQQDIPCSDSSFIDGSVQRNIPKSSGVYTFPVGDKDICRKFGIGLQNGNGDNIYEVEFIKDTPINNTNIDYNKLPGGIFQHFYWRQEIIIGANTQRRIYYEKSDFSHLTNAELLAALTLANTDGVTNWTTPTTSWVVDTINNFVEFNNANSSNNEFWTFGSIEANTSIEEITLPIILTYFDAETINNEVHLNWETSHETNNDFFSIERSGDGVHFSTLSHISGAGNSTITNSYSYIDTSPLSGISYYRLKQTDYNNKTTYSTISEVQTYSQLHVSLDYTSTGIICNVVSSEPDEIFITVLRINGQILQQKSTIILPGIETSIPLTIPTPTHEYYIIHIKTNSFSHKIKYAPTDAQ
ncbi:MAG: hypothetical protein R6U95_05795 [Bacteroidales bacterium]